MGKKLKKAVSSLATTSVAVAVMGTGAISSAVKADEKNTEDINIKQATSDQALKEKLARARSEEAVEIAENQVNLVKSIEKEIQLDVTKQEYKVEEAKSAEVLAASDLSEAASDLEQAQKIAAASTPENIAAVTSDIKTAEDKLAPAEEGLTAATLKVTKQEGVVTEAKDNLHTATQAYEEADQTVKQLELEISGGLDIESKKSEIDRSIKDLTSDLASAKHNLETIKVHVKEKVEEQLAQKVAELRARKKELDQLQADQGAQTAPVGSVVGQNTLVLPSGFPSVVTRETMAANDKAIQSGMYSNEYKTILEDTTELIDASNLSVTQQTELAQFVAELINPIRQQIGLAEAIVTTSAQELARRMSQQYMKQGNVSGHNFKAIYDNAAAVGLRAGDAYGYEALGFSMGVPTTMNMLKSQIYYSLKYMLFTDASSNYGHTLLLLRGDSSTKQYLGVSSSIFNFTPVGSDSAQQIYMIPETSVVSRTFSRNAITLTSTSRVNHSSEIGRLRTEVKALTSDVAVLKNLSSNIATHPNILAAEKSVATISGNLETAKRISSKLESEMDRLKRTTTDQNEAIKKAKASAKLAYAKVQNFESILVSETATLKQLRLEENIAKNKVDKLTKEIADLKLLLNQYNNPNLVAEALKRLDEAKMSYAKSKENLSFEVATLELLMTKLQIAKNTLTRKESELSIAKQVLATLQTEITEEENNQETAPKVLKASNKTGQKSRLSQAEKLSYNVIRSVKNSQELPKTGDSSRLLVELLGFGMLSAATLAAYKRKNQMD